MPTRRDIFRILGSALEAGGQGLLAQQERDFDAEQAALNREIDRENLEVQRARNRLGRDELGLNRDKLALETTAQEARIAKEAQGLFSAEIGDALARGDAPEVQRILSGAVERRPAPYGGWEPEGMADVDSSWWTQMTLPRTPEAAQEIQDTLAKRFGIGQEGSDRRWEDIPEHAITELVRQREAASATPGLSTDPRWAGPPTAAYQTPPMPLLPSGEYLTPTTQHIRGVQEASEAARARIFRELEERPLTKYEEANLGIQRAWANANSRERAASPTDDPCLGPFADSIPECDQKTVNKPFTPVPDQALNLALAHQNPETGGWVFPGQPPDSEGMDTNRAFTFSLIRFDQIIKEEEAEQVRLAAAIARARRQDAGPMPPDESVLRNLENERVQSESNLQQAKLRKRNLQTHYGVRLPLDLEQLGVSHLSMLSPLFDLIKGTDIDPFDPLSLPE